MKLTREEALDKHWTVVNEERGAWLSQVVRLRVLEMSYMVTDTAMPC